MSSNGLYSVYILNINLMKHLPTTNIILNKMYATLMFSFLLLLFYDRVRERLPDCEVHTSAAN